MEHTTEPQQKKQKITRSIEEVLKEQFEKWKVDTAETRLHWESVENSALILRWTDKSQQMDSVFQLFYPPDKDGVFFMEPSSTPWASDLNE